MKKKMKSKKNKTRPAAKAGNKLPVNWPEWAVRGYLIMMLGLFPLYFRNGLFRLGDVKYAFFRTVTTGVLTILAAELTVIGMVRVCLSDGKPRNWFRPVFLRGEVQKRLSCLSVTDYGILAYTGLSLLSWALAENRAQAWTGAPYWYMGLLSQLLLAGIYFAVSRFGGWREWMLWVMAGSGTLVFLMAYLHRFSIDPFGLRQGEFNLGYLGTIGNANFHSAYVCIVLSLMMGGYMMLWRENTREARLRRGLAVPVILLGFGTAVTQNSDSIYAGMGLSFLILLWFALEDGESWKRYVQLWLLAVSAAKVTGILQNAFPERVPLLNHLSFAVTKSRGGWLVLAAVAVIYGITCLMRKSPGAVAKGRAFGAAVRRCRRAIYGLSAAGAVCMLFLMGLSVAGVFPKEGDRLQMTLSELVWRWDNGRRTLWTLCAGAFGAYPLFRKLFGCGPDLLGYHLETYYAEAVGAVWGEVSIGNAHNEWLNAIMNYGLLGGTAYLFLFAVSAVRGLKNRHRHPFLPAVSVSVLAYMAHNFFCFQQTVCAPLIFIVIGWAENMMRENN